MRFVFGYAGLPAGETFDYINKKRSTFEGGNTSFIGFPLPKKSGLSSDHAKLFLDEFESRVTGELDGKTNFVRTSCAVIYLRCGDGRDTLFENQFFPAILPVPIDWQPSGTTPEERRISEKLLYETLLSTAVRTRVVLEVLHELLRDQASKTPLLLPLRNFQSKGYRAWLRGVQADIAAAPDGKLAGNLLAAATKAFEADYPRIWASKIRPSFHDDRGIEFRAPGIRGMHGVPHLKGKHPTQICNLAAVRRLGAPFNAAFHYDAQRPRPKDLTGSFCQCHGEHEPMTGDPHLNIAPNDFIRI